MQKGLLVIRLLSPARGHPGLNHLFSLGGQDKLITVIPTKKHGGILIKNYFLSNCNLKIHFVLSNDLKNCCLLIPFCSRPIGMPDQNASNATSVTIPWSGKNWPKNSDWFCAVLIAPKRRPKLYPNHTHLHQILLFFQPTFNHALLSLPITICIYCLKNYICCIFYRDFYMLIFFNGTHTAIKKNERKYEYYFLAAIYAKLNYLFN